MRYLTIFRPRSGDENHLGAPEHMAQMAKLTETMKAEGRLQATEPLAARSQGARVTLSDGGFTVTEESERAGGYAFLTAGSREEAIQLAKQFLEAQGEGEVEIRQVAEVTRPQA